MPDSARCLPSDGTPYSNAVVESWRRLRENVSLHFHDTSVAMLWLKLERWSCVSFVQRKLGNVTITYFIKARCSLDAGMGKVTANLKKSEKTREWEESGKKFSFGSIMNKIKRRGKLNELNSMMNKSLMTYRFNALIFNTTLLMNFPYKTENSANCFLDNVSLCSKIELPLLMPAVNFNLRTIVGSYATHLDDVVVHCESWRQKADKKKSLMTWTFFSWCFLSIYDFTIVIMRRNEFFMAFHRADHNRLLLTLCSFAKLPAQTFEFNEENLSSFS